VRFAADRVGIRLDPDQVSDGVPGDDAADAKSLVGGQGRQGGEVPPGRVAPQQDAVRVDAVLGAAVRHPVQRAVDVVELSREPGLSRQPVVRADDGESGRRHAGEQAGAPLAERRRGHIAGALPPAAAVQVHHGGQRAIRGRPEEIQFQRTVTGKGGEREGASPGHPVGRRGRRGRRCGCVRRGRRGGVAGHREASASLRCASSGLTLWKTPPCMIASRLSESSSSVTSRVGSPRTTRMSAR
jgi:hypothetical protein